MTVIRAVPPASVVELDKVQKKQKKAGRQVKPDYVFSMDFREGGRLHFEHLIWRLAMPRLFYPKIPPSRLKAVLDVACGSGRWGLEMALKYPLAQIVAVDIDPDPFQLLLEKEKGNIPDNLHFMQHDARLPFPSLEGTFDLVHCRLPDPFIQKHLWTPFLHELLRVVKPDGWVELIVGGIPYHNDRQVTRAYEVILEAGRVLCEDKLGIWQAAGPHLDAILSDAGIVPPFRMSHTIGKTKKTQKMFARDLRHMINSTRSLTKEFDIMDIELFDELLEIYVTDMTRIGIYVDFQRVCFQRKDRS